MRLAEKYAYRVVWDDEAQAFAGTCAELGHLMHFAESQQAALLGVRHAAEDELDALRAAGKKAPQPVCLQNFSGVFTARVPTALHRRLALEAAEARVSLNRFVSMKLAG